MKSISYHTKRANIMRTKSGDMVYFSSCECSYDEFMLFVVMELPVSEDPARPTFSIFFFKLDLPQIREDFCNGINFSLVAIIRAYK